MCVSCSVIHWKFVFINYNINVVVGALFVCTSKYGRLAIPLYTNTTIWVWKSWLVLYTYLVLLVSYRVWNEMHIYTYMCLDCSLHQ